MRLSVAAPAAGGPRVHLESTSARMATWSLQRVSRFPLVCILRAGRKTDPRVRPGELWRPLGLRV
eukprot:2104690-Lingulodinium_polyedra.AAC.1